MSWRERIFFSIDRKTCSSFYLTTPNTPHTHFSTTATPVIADEDGNRVDTMLTLLDAALARAARGGAALDAAAVERLALYCAAWGLGGTLDGDERAGLDAVLRSLSQLVVRVFFFWLRGWLADLQRFFFSTTPLPNNHKHTAAHRHHL